MSKTGTFRPAWKIDKWILIVEAIEYYLINADVDEKKVRFFAEVIADVKGRIAVESLVSAIQGTPQVEPLENPSTSAFEKLDFENWNDEDLDYRLVRHEENILGGRLPLDDLQRLQAEIETRKVRKEESQFKRIRPSSD